MKWGGWNKAFYFLFFLRQAVFLSAGNWDVLRPRVCRRPVGTTSNKKNKKRNKTNVNASHHLCEGENCIKMNILREREGESRIGEGLFSLFSSEG